MTPWDKKGEIVFIPADILVDVFKIAVIFVFLVVMGFMAFGSFFLTLCQKEEISAMETDAEEGTFESAH